MLILAIAAAVSMPAGHAANNVHTFFTNATTVGTCGTLCKGLSTTSGSASTSTVETSLAIGSSPAEDSNAASNKAATWTSGTTISITAFATTSIADTIIIFVASSKTTTPIQSAPSATGFTCDASARKELAISTGVGLSEWVCHTSAAISSETVTVNLSATPTWAIAQIISVNGAEDPTGTFSPFDQNSGFVYNNNRNSGGGTTAPTVTAVSSLNADDLFISASADTGANTQTAGAIGGTTGTLDISTTSTGALAVEHRSVTAILSASSCNFGTATSRWIIFCDALQSAPVYYKVEPETSASLTGIPSTAANGFSGTGWVYNVAGIQNGLFDIQAGTWQIDLTGAVGVTTGTPFARYFVTAWSCTTSSCTTATFLWKNWDTATNAAGSTTATLRTYTSASQSQITWTSGNFLAFEVWVAWQYSGTTATTTMTETTISAAMDFKTPGWDSAQSLSGSLTSASAFARMTAMLKSLSGSLSSVSSFAEKTSIFRAIAASIALTMGNMVANVNSGQLTCNSNPRSCSTTLTATWTMASALAEKSSLFKSLSASLSLVSNLGEKSSLFRSLTGSMSLTPSQVKGLVRALAGSLGSASSLGEKSSLSRSLSGSLSLAGSQVKGLVKALTGSLSLTSGFAEKSSLFRSLSGSLSLAASQVKGLARSLSGSLSLVSIFTEKSSLFRSLTGSLSLAGSQVKGLAKALTGSLSLTSGFAEKSSLFRSLSGSLSLAASETKGLARSLSGSLSLASSFLEKSSLFRSLTGSLSLSSSFAKKSSLFRSLTGALTVASGFVEKNMLFRSLSGSLGLAGFEGKGHTFYYGSNIQTGCAVKCEQLVTSATTPADTATSVKVGGSTTCCFEVQPDVGSSTTTATPSGTTPTGQAWVYPTDLGGMTIQSGSWEFDTTITASRTGTANMRFLVWSCSTASEGPPCTLLFDFTGTANIEATTSATKNIDVSPIEGPFSNVHFLVVEVWISPTVSTGNGAATDTMTTVSSASDVITPAWSYSQSLSAMMNLVSSLAERSSLFRSLSGSLSLASSLFSGRTENLSASLGSASSFAEKSSLFRSLSGSLSLAASQVKGLARSLSGSLSSVSIFMEKSSLFRSLSSTLSLAGSETKGLAKALSVSLALASGFAEKSSLFRSLTGALSSASSFAEKSSLFRSLTGALSSASSFAEKSSLFRSLSGSLSLAVSETKGLVRALTASLGPASSLAERSSIFRSLSGSLSLASSLFRGRTQSLSASLGSVSSLAEKNSIFRSLSGSLCLASS